MYESRGAGSKVSKATMVWLAAVKLLTLGRKPMLYSYQGSLPRLPLPSVNETMQRVSFIKNLKIHPLIQICAVSSLSASAFGRPTIRPHGTVDRRVPEGNQQEAAALPCAQVVVVEQLRVRLVGGFRLPERPIATHGQLQLLRHRRHHDPPDHHSGS